MELVQSHHYIMDEKNSQKRKNEVLFQTDTNHALDTRLNQILTDVLNKMDQDIIDAGNKAKSMVINLKGDVTGKAGVADDYSVTMNTVCHRTDQVPLPINSVQFSLSANAINNLKTVYGGTWKYTGNIQIYNEVDGNTFTLYMYHKTSLT